MRGAIPPEIERMDQMANLVGSLPHTLPELDSLRALFSRAPSSSDDQQYIMD